MFGAWLARFVDVRAGEGAVVARAAGGLFLLVAAHTALETARDGLLLSRFPARDLGAVYVLVALSVFPVAVLTARLTSRWGTRKTLAAGLLVASTALCGLFARPLGPVSVLAVYVVSCLVSAVLIPLFWNVLGGVFTIGQGRRLLGPVGAAGTHGAVSGSGAAAGLVVVVPVKALLLVSAGIALAVALVLPAESLESRLESAPPPPRSSDLSPTRSRWGERQLSPNPPGGSFSEPFVRRLAWLVVTSTAALVLLDFAFARSSWVDR